MYKWDDRYCIGEPLIDSQHQKLFQICERIQRICQDADETRSNQAVAEAVKYLKNYTIEHFKSEEAYQRAVGYAECDAHHQIHEGFTQTVLDQEKLLEENAYATEYIEQFIEIVNNWLVGHIMNFDQAIVQEK